MRYITSSLLGSPLNLKLSAIIAVPLFADVHLTLFNGAPIFRVKISMSKTFADFSLHESLQQALEGLNFTTPTPVQEQSIPAALEG